MRIYRVGGYVRDKLLGIPPTDCDYVVVGSSPGEMLKQGFIQVGNHFPVFLHPKTKEEYALARTERKSGTGHCGFITDSSASVTLNQDLSRRDLTINAIAEDQHGRIIDPYGGVTDLKNKTLRHISPAFRDDPLRILRVARFAARFNFIVAPETQALLKEMAKTGEGRSLSRERVFAELFKALTGKVSVNFFKVLRESGNLEIFFPCLNSVLADEDNFNQFCTAIDYVENSDYRYLALAILLAKHPDTFQEISNSKAILNYMRICSQIHQATAHRLSSQETLQLIKNTNALRNIEPFLKALANYQDWLNLNNDLNQSQRLSFIRLCVTNLQNPPNRELIGHLKDPAAIAKAIMEWQLSTIDLLQKYNN